LNSKGVKNNRLWDGSGFIENHGIFIERKKNNKYGMFRAFDDWETPKYWEI
jgi:hypothetical protein